MSTKKNLIIEKRNSELYLRPRFSIELDENYKSILTRFSDEFKKEEIIFRGSVSDTHIFINVPQQDEHFWSPQLHLELIEISENETELKGLFGPKPQVWTLFMFIHFVIGTLFIGFCVLLYTQISLNEAIIFPLIVIVVLPLVWILLYFLGKIGKDTGKSQMKKLHEFMVKLI